MNQIKIGRFIQKLRKDLNMTQKELSDKLGVSDKTVSKWETGNGMPDMVFLMQLTSILGITVNELLCGEKIKDKDINKKSEEVIKSTLVYSEKEIKKNKLSVSIIIFGCLILVAALLFFTSNGMTAIYSIISLLIISFGIYRIRNTFKLLMSSFFFILTFLILLLMDYSNVSNNGIEPIFSLSIVTKETIIIYNNLFYKVYRCNRNTANEYYEIDFKGKKQACTNPFDPNISDISRLVRYKNKYLGNNSNTANLYYNLPLSKYGYTLEIDRENLGITINYNNTEFYINENNKDELFVKKSLIYNAITSFILIDNLEYIIYNFSGTTYKIKETDLKAKFESYDELLINNEVNQENFRKFVEAKLFDVNFVDSTFYNIFSSK